MFLAGRFPGILLFVFIYNLEKYKKGGLVVKKIISALDEHFEEYLLVAIMAIMSIVICYQVFMRYVMQASLSWSEELARYLFVWMAYLAISYGVKKEQHVCVEAFTLLFPEKKRWIFDVIGDVVFAIFSVLVLYYSVGVIQQQIKVWQTSPGMQLPMVYVYIAPFVGFVCVLIRLIQDLIRIFKANREEGGIN